MKILFIALSCFGTMLAFQNCSKAQFQPTDQLANSSASSVSNEEPPPAPKLTVLTGDWGADRVANFSVSEDGAYLDLACAGAEISGKVEANEQGEFEADGLWHHEGGATPIGGFPTTPVHFKGKIDGKILSLSLSFKDGSTANDFQLVSGVTALLMRCY